MRVVSSWGAPLGFAEFFFVPAYWTPQSLFDFAVRFHLDIESFIVAFSIAGIASVIYEWFLKSAHGPLVVSKDSLGRYNFVPITLALVIFFVLLIVAEVSPIYAACIALLIGAIIIGYERRDLVKKILIGGILFSLFYLLILFVLTTIYPDFLLSALNISILSVSGTVADIPWSQVMFSLSYGFFFSGIYEYVFRRKLIGN